MCVWGARKVSDKQWEMSGMGMNHDGRKRESGRSGMREEHTCARVASREDFWATIWARQREGDEMGGGKER